MSKCDLTITYVGGPTALIEVGNFHILTDPTFDPAGTEYDLGVYRLRKTVGPAILPGSLPPIDVVLLSHDHHLDNLDHKGRAFLKNIGKVLTTPPGAARLGKGAQGMDQRQSVEMPACEGLALQVTATPARHGPAHHDRGPVTGFVLSWGSSPGDSIYISGDTVWYEGVAEVARRFSIKTAILFMGAARVPAVEQSHLTMTAEEGVLAARAFSEATILPLHFEGWAHFSETREDIQRAFVVARLEHRLCWRALGVPTPLPDNLVGFPRSRSQEWNQ